MKSAFQLCEPFFYVAWHGPDRYHAIINPWANDLENLHSDWEEVTSDEWEKLFRVGESLSPDATSGFLLWIPLRKKSHLRTSSGAATGAIIGRFPGDAVDGSDLKFLSDEDLPRRLSVVLPLLRNLQTITYRAHNAVGADFCIHIDTQSRLEREVSEAQSSGTVNNGDRSLFCFHGEKKEGEVSTESVFSELKSNPAWPKTYYRDELGHSRQASDKSQAEGSIVIGHQDGVVGGLTISWAVFLPLDDEAHRFRATIPGSSRHYHVVIHGQFFVTRGVAGFTIFQRRFLIH